MGIAHIDGGIADGRSFELARLPNFLRIVHGPENKKVHGHFDALDLLDDQPFESDTIYVYKQTSMAFVCRRGRGAHSGPEAFYAPATGFEGFKIRTTKDWQAAVAFVTGDKINERGEVEDG
jgi:hypothetical protein